MITSPSSRGRAPLHRRALAGLLLAGCLGVGGCASAPSATSSARPDEQSATPTVTPTATAPSTASAAPTPSAAPPALGEGREPVAVTASTIGLSEELIELGIDDDGRMEVPSDFDDVGWFTGGGKPGGRGPTVIAGHVDSVTAPAVFVRLHELAPGDEVEVTDVDGGVTTYVVTDVADFPKDDFPTARVFGATPADELRLITCGGYFDANSGHYEDNRVVFASAVS